MGNLTLEVTAQIQRTALDTIRLERFMRASPETIWRYLTVADLRARWFAGGTDVDGEGPLELVFNHDALSSENVPCPAEYVGHKGTVHKEHVLRFEPPHVLAFTFGKGRKSIATFELFSERGGTRLVLTHSGIENPTGAQGFGSGWNSHLLVLQEKLAGRSVPDFWALHAKSRELVAQALD